MITSGSVFEAVDVKMTNLRVIIEIVIFRERRDILVSLLDLFDGIRSHLFGAKIVQVKKCQGYLNKLVKIMHFWYFRW